MNKVEKNILEYAKNFPVYYDEIAVVNSKKPVAIMEGDKLIGWVCRQCLGACRVLDIKCSACNNTGVTDNLFNSIPEHSPLGLEFFYDKHLNGRDDEHKND